MEPANMEGLRGPQKSSSGETFPEDTIDERQREEAQRQEAYSRIRAARKRKNSSRRQRDTINKPYNTSKFASFKDEVFPKPVVTNPSTESSTKARIISDTGLLGEYNLELDLNSDSSSSSPEEAKDNALSSTVANEQDIFRKERVLQTVRILNALWVKPNMWGIRMDGRFISVFSTFDADSLTRQLKSAEKSSVANPVWQLGFDHQVLARQDRNLPEFLIGLQKVVRYLGTCDRNTFKQYIESLADEREQLLVTIRGYIEPCRKTEVSPGFEQLAADFFGGREVVEDYATVDLTQSESNLIDTPESAAEVGESEKPYKITYQSEDRVKFLYGDALRDIILLTFLTDSMLSREIQEMIDKDAKFRSMKVYHSTERAAAMARLNSLELSHSRGESAWWREKGFKVKVLTDGTIQTVDNTIVVTRIGGNSKIGPETKEAPRIVELDADEIPEEMEVESKPEPMPTKSKKKKKAKKTKGPAEVEEKSEVTENPAKKSPDTHEELEVNGHSEAKEISDTKEDEVKGKSSVKEDENTRPLRNCESGEASIQQVARPNLAKSNNKTKAKKIEHKSGVEDTEEQLDAKEESVAKEDPDGKKDVGISNTKEASNESDEKSDPKPVEGNADAIKAMATPDSKETSKQVGNNSGSENPKKVAIVEDTLTDKTPEHEVSPLVPEQLHENPNPQEAQPKPVKPKNKSKTKTPKANADVKDDKKSEAAEVATVGSPTVEPSGKDSLPKEAQAKSAKPKNKSKAKEVKQLGNAEDNKKVDTKENGVADIPQSEEVNKVNVQEDAHPEATTPAKKKKNRFGYRHRNKRNLDNDAPTSASNPADSQPDHSAEAAKSTLDVPLNEHFAAKGYDGSTSVDAKTVAKQIDTPTVDSTSKTPTVSNTDGNVPVTIPVGMAGNNTTPSDVKAETRNPGWKQVKKPKAQPKPKASKNTVSNGDQVLPLTDTGSAIAAPNNVVVPKPGHEQVVRSNAESTVPAPATPLKVRRDSGQSTSTIISPAVVDLNTSVLTSDHAADISALSSVGYVSKVADIVAEDQQAALLTSTDVSPVKAPNLDQPTLEAVGIKGDHHENVEKKTVPGSDLAWADLTTQTKLPARQRLPSLQAKETRFKEAGDPTLKEEVPLQKTRVRDPRVLAIQFGDIPIGFGLELPIGTSREPRLIFPGTLPSMAGTNSSFDESKVQTPTKMNDSPPFESPSASSKYYTPSPLYDPAIPVMQSPESQFDGSGAVPPHDTVLEARGSRAYSAPYPPSTLPTAPTNEMSGSMYGEQMPPSVGGFSYASQQHSFSIDEEIPSPFTCICCRVNRRPTPQAPVYFCPFCGPLTNIRYCSRACILADAFDHARHCVNCPASQTLTVFDPPVWCVYDKDAILSVQDWGTPSRELFRQKTFSMYCFSGPFPNICQAWMLNIKDREGTYPAEVDFGKITGDYHIFRSESSATGRFSPSEVITTFRLPDNDPMKRDFNRVLTTCFMFYKVDPSLAVFLYRLIRHFICHDSYYRHSFPAVPREILWPEFKHQFQQEWGVSYSEHAEPPILELDKEWPLIHHILLRYEHTYPELVIHLMRKLLFPDPAMPNPLR